MRSVKGVFLEPVGCLAEFPPAPFLQISAELFGRRKSASKSGSRSYWHMLTMMETANETWDVSAVQKAEELEVQAVDAAAVYEDVLPALAELKEMGLTLALTSSLSHRACSRFLERFGLKKYFAAVSARGDDGGVKVAPLARALTVTSLRP